MQSLFLGFLHNSPEEEEEEEEGMAPPANGAHTSRTINYFFCHVPSMLTLLCMDTSVYEYTVFISTILFLVFPLLGILCSYGSRKKVYSTWGSHLNMVTFYYAPFAHTYLQPKYFQSPEEDNILPVFYIFLTPMLNPVIYSLRNNEVLGALERVTQRIYSGKW
ncbi:Olfactory receptor 2L3 [Heterocephalus glaber]|uniref:Olfactory receptor 2L3 n=1 Tax=Heterocephalus glaber TaxID=10181 RepID=G5BBF2_HETGA|nr:Olfactory receptor 2L3 [Heterocephalus glaber]